MRLTLNGAPVDTGVSTLLGLVGHLPPGHAAAVNDQVVPRAEHGSWVLVDGDRVEVVTAVPGG
jgi:sulfur carrier protein